MDYAEKLNDPRWQKKRVEVFERDGWKCRECRESQENDAELHAHHIRYLNNMEPWEYDSDEIITLCKSCHGYTHDNRGDHEAQLIESFRLMGLMCMDIINFRDVMADYKTDPDLHEFVIAFIHMLTNRKNDMKKKDEGSCF